MNIQNITTAVILITGIASAQATYVYADNRNIDKIENMITEVDPTCYHNCMDFCQENSDSNENYQDCLRQQCDEGGDFGCETSE